VKAIRISKFGDPEVLEYVDVPAPQPGPRQVRIAVHAAGTNPVDTGNRKGRASVSLDLPWTPGYDVAGVVDAVGEHVDQLSIGERVMAMTGFPHGAGGYAEYVVVDADAVAALAAETSYVLAAAAPLAAGTALEIVNRLQLPAGQRLLVLAASGGVGSYLLQLAALRGVDTMAMGSVEHHDRMRDLGATVCVDYRRDDATTEIERLGGQVDAIADLVGGGELMKRISILRDGGQVASIQTPELDVSHVLDRNISFHGVLIGDDGARTRELAALLASGQLVSIVAEILPMSNADEAHRILESRHAGGKVILVPDSVFSATERAR
jgi:NADPH:quinone reductase